jgi:hypothetical protein
MLNRLSLIALCVMTIGCSKPPSTALAPPPQDVPSSSAEGCFASRAGLEARIKLALASGSAYAGIVEIGDVSGLREFVLERSDGSHGYSTMTALAATASVSPLVSMLGQAPARVVRPENCDRYYDSTGTLVLGPTECPSVSSLTAGLYFIVSSREARIFDDAAYFSQFSVLAPVSGNSPVVLEKGPIPPDALVDLTPLSSQEALVGIDALRKLVESAAASAASPTSTNSPDTAADAGLAVLGLDAGQ